MSQLEHLRDEHIKGRISRREFTGRAAALGATAATITSLVGTVEAYAQETPKKGGSMKVGIAGGSTTDSINPTTYTDSAMVFTSFAIFSSLVENGPDNKSIPELAPRFRNTLFLAVYAAVVAVPLSVALGLLAAIRQGSFYDRAVNFVTLLTISVPEYFLAYILIKYLTVRIILIKERDTRPLWRV